MTFSATGVGSSSSLKYSAPFLKFANQAPISALNKTTKTTQSKARMTTNAPKLPIDNRNHVFTAKPNVPPKKSICSTKYPRKIELHTMNKLATANDLLSGNKRMFNIHLNPIKKSTKEIANEDNPNQRYMNK